MPSAGPMKILLFGKTGQLGWELNRALAPLGEICALGPGELDLADLQALMRTIREFQPGLIINASAYTAVDQAESEIELATLINTKVPQVMAEAAHELRAPFIHYSTDYVFDGTKGSAYTEDDTVHPLNVYGQSKLEGEQAIGQVGGAHVILRTSWVYSLRGNGFVSKVLSWARKQESLKIVTDQVGSPTWARMLAETTSAMVACGVSNLRDYLLEKSGVYHLGGAGGVSRFDFTKTILDFDPHPEEQLVKKLESALTADFPTPAQRPLCTPLDCSRFERVFGLRLPPWRQALELAMGE
ncbi:MAG: dTDP-4-dehydrorhamnose reductase [Anaerolineales bacterium]